MNKLRSISTAFWSDPFVEELNPEEKLLFIYLITNSRTNMLGIYEASIKKIAFETDIEKSKVKTYLDNFQSSGKVRYEDNYVILVNYLKHQKFNTNMKKSAIDAYNDLPNSLKINDLKLDREKVDKSFETLSNHLGMVRKIEIEDETELEVKEETETESNSDELLEIDLTYEEVLDDVATAEIWPTFNDFWELYDHKKGKANCEKKWAKLKQAEKEAIMQHVPLYVQSTPEKRFRKHPTTYLNGEHWNDEISVNDVKKSAQDKQLETIQKNIQAFGL